MPKGRPKATAKTMAVALSRERQALELRMAGKGYQAIGDALGITAPGAADAVRRAIAKLEAETAEKAEEVRRLELDRLDAMLEGLWEKAQDGDPQAIDRVLRIQERRAKYLGIDAPAPRASEGDDNEGNTDVVDWAPAVKTST